MNKIIKLIELAILGLFLFFGYIGGFLGRDIDSITFSTYILMTPISYCIFRIYIILTFKDKNSQN